MTDTYYMDYCYWIYMVIYGYSNDRTQYILSTLRTSNIIFVEMHSCPFVGFTWAAPPHSR